MSVDDVATQDKFCKDNNLPFPLLSDSAKTVARAYGVLIEERGMASRVTFVIDRAGKVRHIEAGNSAISPAGAIAALQSLR